MKESEKRDSQEMPGFGGFAGYKKIVDRSSQDAQKIIDAMKDLVGDNGRPRKTENGRYKKLQRELDDLKVQSRRAVLLALRDGGIVVGGVLAAAGTGMFLSLDENDENVDNTDTSHIADAGSEPSKTLKIDAMADTDRLIEVVEKGWIKFEEKVAPFLVDLVDSDFKNELNSPFKIMKINRENPDKNARRFHEDQLASGNTTAKIGNPYWFFIDSNVDLPGNIIAGFDPTAVVMSLSASFDPEDDIDQLVLYHELRHVAQGANTRMKITSEEEYKKYVAFLTGAKRLVINEEASAYAYEIDLLNLLCGGELLNAVKEGRSVNMEIVNAKIKTKNKGILKMLIDLSKLYYPEGVSTGNFNKIFLDMIADTYAKDGAEIYIPLSGGGLRRIR